MTDTTLGMVSELDEQIAELQTRRDTIQNKCEHTRVTYSHSMSEGSPYQDDYYWNDIVCIDCNKRMHFDGDHPDYSLNGVIGSRLKVDSEKYKTYLAIKRLLDASECLAIKNLLEVSE